MMNLCLLANDDMEGRVSVLEWVLETLGVSYTLTIAISSMFLLWGACWFVWTQRRPAVIAAYYAFVPIPLMFGVLGTVQGFLQTYEYIAYSEVQPDPSTIAEGMAVSTATMYIAIIVTMPTLIVLSIGLFVKTIKAANSGEEYIR